MSYEPLVGMGDTAQAQQLFTQYQVSLERAEQQRTTAGYAEALNLARQALAADPARSARYDLAQIPPLVRLGRCSEASTIFSRYGTGDYAGDPTMYIYRSLVGRCGTQPGGASIANPTALSIPIGSYALQVTTPGLIVAGVVGLGAMGLLVAVIAKKKKKGR